MAESDNDKVRQGFQVLLRNCLRIDNSDELIVIFDESLDSLSEIFFEEALRRELSMTPIFMPHGEQVNLSNASGAARSLPAGVLASISASTVIITFLLPSPDTLAFRRAVIQQPRPGNCRLAHLPGISPEVLEVLSISPIEEIYARCEQLAWALGEASTADITTIDPDGTEHHLNVPLGAWGNEPLMSPGVIVPGTWGNIPPGETFICPIEEGTYGSLYLDGSLPGFVIPSGTGFALFFQDGRLIDWKVTGSFPGSDFFDKEKARAIRDEDPDWNVVAELGIGANPAIRRLTGIMLFDEKAINTAHIAIGDNTVFGHDNSARVHHDLVVRKPSIQIDKWPLLERGVIKNAEISKKRKELTFSGTPNAWLTIQTRQSRCRLRSQAVDRRLQSGDRVGYVGIAEGEAAEGMIKLLSELNTYSSVTVEQFLMEHPSFCGVAATELLQTLLHYRMVTLLGAP